MIHPGAMTRRAIETKIEELIALLDLIDGEPDFERDNDGEPSLGAPEQMVQAHWYHPVSPGICDTELEDEHDEEGEPAELNGDEEDEDNPSLGINGAHGARQFGITDQIHGHAGAAVEEDVLMLKCAALLPLRSVARENIGGKAFDREAE